MDALITMLAPVCYMLLIGVDPNTILVPVGSAVVAASFAFSSSAQAFTTCLVFVLVQRPYDKDDMVRGTEGTMRRVPCGDVETCGVYRLRSALMEARTVWTRSRS